MSPEMWVGVGCAVALGAYWRRRQQARRLAVLAGCLRPYRIESLMEQLLEGYPRAQGEPDAMRQVQIWSTLQGAEQMLSQQFGRFATDVQRVPAAEAAMGRWSGLGLPQRAGAAPGGFDLRALMQLHERGIRACTTAPEDETPAGRRQRAYTLSAELLLMQHSCHWYCRSHATATARLLARHQTPLQQVLQHVTPATRRDYRQLTA